MIATSGTIQPDPGTVHLRPFAGALMSHLRGFAPLLGLLLVMGCGGESTQDKMLRMAQQRANINRAEKELDAVQNSPPPAAEAPQPAEPAAPPADASAAAATPTDAAPQPVATPPAPDATVPSTATASAPAVPATPVPPSEPVAVDNSLPRRDELLLFSRLGQQVAFVGESRSIGIYDVKTKALSHQLYNPELTPFSMAIGELGTTFAVGGMDGGLKIFSLESTEGLDKFQKNRLLRRDADPPRKAHDNPVTAVAISESAGVVATADSQGQIKLWSTQIDEPLELSGDAEIYKQLLSYQNDQLLLAATEDKIVYWQLGKKQTTASDFPDASFDKPVTEAVLGPDGKGLAVGDAAGRVTLWTAEGKDLAKTSFPAHAAAIAGLGFSSDAKTLFTATKTGDIARWELPIEPQQNFNVVEPPKFVVGSPDGLTIGVSSRDKNLDLYSVVNGKELRRHTVGNARLTAAAFSADSKLVALANHQGRVLFQDSNQRPVAYTQLADSAITQLIRSPSGKDRYAFTTEQGAVGVASFPETSGPLTASGELARINENGSLLVISRESELRSIRMSDGVQVNAARSDEGKVTAIAIHQNLAILGTSSGSVLMWSYQLDQSKPEVLASGIHDSEIRAIGLTRSGDVWSCDAQGNTRQTALQKVARRSSGSLNFPISDAAALPDGSVFVLDDQRKLRTAATIDGDFTVIGDQVWSEITSGATSIAAIDREGGRVGLFSSRGTAIASIGRAASKPRSAEIAASTLALTFDDESAVRLQLPSVDPTVSRLGEGNLRGVWISGSGQVVVALDENGRVHLSDAAGTSRMLELPQGGVPLALSRQGDRLLVDVQGRLTCFAIAAGAVTPIAELPAELVQPSAACFSADGNLAYLALASGAIVAIEVAKDAVARTVIELPKPATAIEADEQGKRIGCLGQDGALSIVELGESAAQLRYNSGATPFSAMSIAGGRIYACNAGGELYRLADDGANMALIAGGLGANVAHLAADSRGELVAAATPEGQLQWVSTSTGVVLTSAVGADPAEPLALRIGKDGNEAIVCDRSGQAWRSPLISIAALAPKSSGLAVLAVSSPGKSLLGLRSDGSLVRWTVDANGKPTPRRINIPAKAVDIRAVGDAGKFAILCSDNQVYALGDAESDAQVAIKVDEKFSKIICQTVGETLLLATEGGVRLGNLARGTVEPLGAGLEGMGQTSQLFAAASAGGRTWVALSADGSYTWADRLTSSPGGASGALRSAPVDVVISGDLLVAADKQGVAIQRPDGNTVGSIPAGQREFGCLAVHDATSKIAVCDAAGGLTILRLDNSTTIDAKLPITKIKSLAWSDDASRIAATDGKRLVAINASDGKVQSQLLLGAAIAKLVGWSEGRLWFLDDASRLQRLIVPSLDWSRELGGPATGLAWSRSGKELVVTIKNGDLVKVDASLGNELSRIASGKPDPRGIQAIANSDRFAVLAGGAEILLLEPAGQLVPLPVSSGVRVESIACSRDGRHLFATNSLGQILSWDLTKLNASASMIPCEISCNSLVPIGEARLAAFGSQQARIAIISASLRTQIVHQANRQLSSVMIARNGSLCATADGSNEITLFPLGGGEPRKLKTDGQNVDLLTIDPLCARVTAIARSAIGGGSALVVWETVDLKEVARRELAGDADKLTSSLDGGLIAVGFSDGHCEVFDGRSATLLESIPAAGGLESLAFSQDGSKLLLARGDGTVAVQPLMILGQSQAGDSAVVSLSFHGGGKYLLCAAMNGSMTLWNRVALGAPQAAFEGLAAPIAQSKVSSDGRYVLAVYEDPENSTFIWDLNASGSSASKIEPKLIIRSSVKTSSAAFTSDSNYLLVGGNDGLIRAWSLAENRAIAQFQGHEGPVMDIAPTEDAAQFVSGGIDHAIRFWRFPSSLPPPGAEIPQGALADATEVKNLAPPSVSKDVKEEDPNDAARQALIAGAGTSDILDLLQGDNQVKAEAKASLAEIVALENDANASPAELWKQRRRLVESQRRLAPSEQANSLANFADGFSNLVFVADTNFKFGLEGTYRPVRLLFADPFLYAARPSEGSQPARLRDAEGNEYLVDEGDNGALLSWDYRYSQLQAHAWSIENLKVSRLFALPNNSGVFTVPRVILFSQDGSSREMNDIASWAASNQPSPQRQFLAVGSEGAFRVESDILKVFDVADLTRETVAPVSQYRGFEGVVTAMAFANNSPYLAFAVRERAVHRLFLADAENLELTKLEEHNHDKPWLEQEQESGVPKRSDAAPGITAIAFSPDDSLLMTHGQYADDRYNLSRWKIAWKEGQPAAVEKDSAKSLEQESPFFVDSGGRSVWFISEPAKKVTTPDGQVRLSVSGQVRVLVMVSEGFRVVNLNSRREERTIPFVETHHGIPEHAVSNDGRWLIMGDDNGLAYIWDTLEGHRYTLTIDSETEKRVQAADRQLKDLPERPAHTGPIVGVAFSEPDEGADYPAFAATIGEENKVKVWGLFPILDPQQGVRATVKTRYPVTRRSP